MPITINGSGSITGISAGGLPDGTVAPADLTTGGPNWDANGRLLLGGVSANANGGILQISNGITFPATQSACSDVNTLDDYEEGTWTPVIPGTSITHSAQQGVYTKIGNVVYIRFYVVLSGGTPTGGVAASCVTGLPFTSEATQYWPLTTTVNGCNFGGTVPVAQVPPSGTTISGIGITNNAAFVDSTATSIWDANGNWLQCTGFYRVA